jgi:sialic acid synthase SpsE
VGNDALVLLHCVSSYPAPARDVNLRAMHTLSAAFGFPTGYSDHTLGVEVALAAVALGAEVIEKHFTLDKKLPGPDHQASLEPHELARLVEGIRVVESALGSTLKRRTESEADTAAVARKSIVAACDIAAGSVLTAQMLTLKRPGTGLAPAELAHVIGRRLTVDVAKDELLMREMFL